jgi:hypothetical protein
MRDRHNLRALPKILLRHGGRVAPGTTDALRRPSGRRGTSGALACLSALSSPHRLLFMAHRAWRKWTRVVRRRFSSMNHCVSISTCTLRCGEAGDAGEMGDASLPARDAEAAAQHAFSHPERSELPSAAPSAPDARKHDALLLLPRLQRITATSPSVSARRSATSAPILPCG